MIGISNLPNRFYLIIQTYEKNLLLLLYSYNHYNDHDSPCTGQVPPRHPPCFPTSLRVGGEKEEEKEKK